MFGWPHFDSSPLAPVELKMDNGNRAVRTLRRDFLDHQGAAGTIEWKSWRQQNVSSLRWSLGYCLLSLGYEETSASTMICRRIEDLKPIVALCFRSLSMDLHESFGESRHSHSKRKASAANIVALDDAEDEARSSASNIFSKTLCFRLQTKFQKTHAVLLCTDSEYTI